MLRTIAAILANPRYIVMAYQNSDGTSTLHVFNAGSSWAGRWYTGGQYNLANVAGRLIVGNWY